MLAREKAPAYCRLSRPATASATRAVDEEKSTMVPLVAELTCKRERGWENGRSSLRVGEVFGQADVVLLKEEPTCWLPSMEGRREGRREERREGRMKLTDDRGGECRHQRRQPGENHKVTRSNTITGLACLMADA